MNGFPWAAFAAGLAATAGASLAVMLLFAARGFARDTHRVVDIAWGTAFAAVAVTSYGLSAGHGDATRRLLLTVLTVLWGVRLASHIAWRGRGKGEDPRYARMLGPPPRSALRVLAKVYLLQGALAWFVSLPVQVGMYAGGTAGALAVAGTALWLVGMFFEATGDYQLARFKDNPANRGRIMDRGVWNYTRHPNYFGDFCVWWGLFLVAAAFGDDGWAVSAVAVVSPLLMSYLLIGGSGKRLLERHMAERPGYAEYAARTSGFVPLPPRRTRPGGSR